MDVGTAELNPLCPRAFVAVVRTHAPCARHVADGLALFPGYRIPVKGKRP